MFCSQFLCRIIQVSLTMASLTYYFQEEVDNVPTDPREQAFHNMIREYLIVFLILLTLYGCSYVLISTYRRRKDEVCFLLSSVSQLRFYHLQIACYSDEEDALVYRISLWMCTFSMAISIGAALLLPFSLITNEILILYPDNYYMQWLNVGLVQSLWNNVFLFSNLSLFLLLPFAYFFTESEGFSGSKRGIMARVNETMVLLLLLAILVFGMTYLLCLILGYNDFGLRNVILIWQYLPFLYSCVSFLGVCLLLLCTPVGIAKLFTVLGELIVKPRFLRNVQEEFDQSTFEEMHLKRRLESALRFQQSTSTNFVTPDSRSKSMPSLASENLKILPTSKAHSNCPPKRIGNYIQKSPEVAILEKDLMDVKTRRRTLELQRKASAFRRNFVSFEFLFHDVLNNLMQGYPLAMLVLAALTVVAAVLVAQNTLELLVGIKALPVSSAQQLSLGIASLSKLGLVGSALEVTLILYLWCASVVGLYSLPVICRLTPVVGDTSFTQIIGNCALLLILSSALPVLSRIVGISNFDLLGDFGRIEWLGSFYVVFIYNIIFASTTALSLTNKFTEPVRKELMKRLRSLASFQVEPSPHKIPNGIGHFNTSMDHHKHD